MPPPSFGSPAVTRLPQLAPSPTRARQGQPSIAPSIMSSFMALAAKYRTGLSFDDSSSTATGRTPARHSSRSSQHTTRVPTRGPITGARKDVDASRSQSPEPFAFDLSLPTTDGSNVGGRSVGGTAPSGRSGATGATTTSPPGALSSATPSGRPGPTGVALAAATAVTAVATSPPPRHGGHDSGALLGYAGGLQLDAGSPSRGGSVRSNGTSGYVPPSPATRKALAAVRQSVQHRSSSSSSSGGRGRRAGDGSRNDGDATPHNSSARGSAVGDQSYGVDYDDASTVSKTPRSVRHGGGGVSPSPSPSWRSASWMALTPQLPPTITTAGGGHGHGHGHGHGGSGGSVSGGSLAGRSVSPSLSAVHRGGVDFAWQSAEQHHFQQQQQQQQQEHQQQQQLVQQLQQGESPVVSPGGDDVVSRLVATADTSMTSQGDSSVVVPEFASLAKLAARTHAAVDSRASAAPPLVPTAPPPPTAATQVRCTVAFACDCEGIGGSGAGSSCVRVYHAAWIVAVFHSCARPCRRLVCSGVT